MNPTIRIQHANGAHTTFDLDEAMVLRVLCPRKLVELMAQFHRARAFTNLTSLDMLPLSGSFVKDWQKERELPWFEQAAQPAVEWRFQERFENTTEVEGPPIAIVYGDVNLSAFVQVVGGFFGSQAVITGVRCG